MSLSGFCNCEYLGDSPSLPYVGSSPAKGPMRKGAGPHRQLSVSSKSSKVRGAEGKGSSEEGEKKGFSSPEVRDVGTSGHRDPAGHRDTGTAVHWGAKKGWEALSHTSRPVPPKPARHTQNPQFAPGEGGGERHLIDSGHSWGWTCSEPALAFSLSSFCVRGPVCNAGEGSVCLFLVSRARARRFATSVP